MNKTLYKKSFKHITVSDSVINRVITISALHNENNRSSKRLISKRIIPAAVILAISIFSVSAAPALGLDLAFRSFFSQFFGTNMSDNELEIINKYGYAPNSAFSKDGVKLTVEGVIGDNSLLYIKYSVAMDKDYDYITHQGILSKVLYIGELKENIRPNSVSTSSLYRKGETDIFDYAVIYSFSKETSLSGQNATLVMKFPGRYQSVGIDLYKTYSSFGVTTTDKDEIYSLPNSLLNIPFKNEYGDILLQSIGYVNGQLILAVDVSGYYETPVLYLRNNRTGMIYSRNDGFTSVERGNLRFYSFAVNSSDELKDLEIAMPEEQHFSFPLNYTDNSRTFDLSNKNFIVNNNTSLKKISLSPLSITIYGKTPSGQEPSFTDHNCSIRMKDNTVYENYKLGRSISSRDENGDFIINLQFEAPLDIDTVKALVIDSVYTDEAVEITLE